MISSVSTCVFFFSAITVMLLQSGTIKSSLNLVKSSILQSVSPQVIAFVITNIASPLIGIELFYIKISTRWTSSSSCRNAAT